jgi:biopolymer transport protein ExbD
MVEDESVVDVPADASHGVEAKYKRGGPNDLYITKLGQTVKSWRDIDRQVRQAQGKDASGSEAIVIADKDTPYRLLVEVLFTLGQNEFNKFHLMVLQSSKPGG